MTNKSATCVFVASVILAVALVEYIRMSKTMPIKQHQEELATVRAEAENHYRQAVGEEAHRREMNLLFRKATARIVSASARAEMAGLGLRTSALDAAKYAAASKEADEALSQLADAVAEAKYAKTELERLGVTVAWPEGLPSQLSER